MSDPHVFTVGKADPTGKQEPPGAVLHITADLKTVRETLPRVIWVAANRNIHVEDAQQVCAALAHLPQGTLDQVLLRLLEQRASLLRVAGPFPTACLPGALPEEPRGTEAPAEEPPTAQVVDLMAALKASLAAANPRKEPA